MLPLLPKLKGNGEAEGTILGKRMMGIYVALVLVFSGMLCRLYVLSSGELLASAANTQSAFLLEVDRSRGVIYDRDLVPLVGTHRRTVAAVQPSPEANTALAEAINEYGHPIEFDPEATRPYLLELGEARIYAPYIEMFEIQDRYSQEQLAPHVIGYLSPEQDHGAAGIELSYDTILKQYEGSLSLRYTLDASGQALRADTMPEVVRENYQNPGGVVLTLDADIQRAAQTAMEGVEKGAAVVMDVNTGDLAAVVSVPAYDANQLAESLYDPNSPFVNRAFSQYNVGSTFKLVTAAAALENGYGKDTPYTCVGAVDVNGQIFHCHWRIGHGEIDLKKAIEISCNPFFINLGLEVGGKPIVSLAREIGFSKAAVFSEDLSTQSGTLPSDNELRDPAAVANLSFGQGSLTATPVQIAQMISTVANGGYAVTPRLVEGFTDDGETFLNHTPSYAPNRVISKRTSDILRDCLVSNVEEGSGVKAKPLYGTAGGKTASAQTGIYLDPEDEDSEIVHAWFAGYYPAQQPQYAIVVLVEGGESGSDAAGPIFRRIADAIHLIQLK